MPSCAPPFTVHVRGYYRVSKRRRRKATRKGPAGPYWVVENSATKHVCGHHHRTLSGAVACRRRHERAQRAMRARYGRGTSPGYWTSEPRGRG